MSGGGFFEFHEQVRRKPPARPSPPAESRAQPEPITVSQLTNRIDRAIKTGIPETIYLRGEVSNYRPNQASGHVYFTMKDAVNCIDCVMWQSDAVRLKFTPTAGIELLATGRVTVYGVRGRYQLQVSNLRPLGKGALELAFQQLRAKLEGEGLFDPDRKMPLPAYPKTIVLVTGANTAALQDMLKVLRRFTWLRLLLYPVPVQGEGASSRIAAAIHHVSQCAEDVGADVILLGRGGGSLEDLWAFNEEKVARAIAASRLPIITGIGHEVDTTIADLVADYHAHTPTEAAQIVTAQWRSARQSIDTISLRLGRLTLSMLQDARQRLRHIERHEIFRRPLDRINTARQLLDDRQRALSAAVSRRLHDGYRRVEQFRGRLDRHMPAALNRLRERISVFQSRLLAAISGRIRTGSQRLDRSSTRMVDHHPRHTVSLHDQRLTGLALRLDRAAKSNLLLRRQTLDALERQLKAVGPENVLRRGYTITMRKKDKSILRARAAVKPGDRLITRFAEGEVESVAEDPKQPGLFE